MKIAYLLTENIDPDGSSGASAHIRENCRELTNRGNTIDLIRNPSDLRASDIIPIRKSFLHHIYKSAKTLLPPIIASVKNDLLHDSKSNRLIHDNYDRIKACDIIYERDAYHSFGLLKHIDRIKMPWVIECNGIFWEESEFYSPVFSKKYKANHLNKWNKADHIIVVSNNFKRILTEEGISPDKISVVHNGVRLQNYIDTQHDQLLNKKTDSTKSALTIGFIGHILPWHRIDLLLHTIKLLLSRGHNVRGLVIGGGLFKEYTYMASELGVADYVRFTGPIPSDSVPKAMSQIDIAVLPGIYEPGSPVKLFDYGASSKPVIAADFPSIKELISHNTNGLLFCRGDINDFASQLELLINNYTLRSKLACNLHKLITTEYTWERVAQKTEDILNRTREEYQAKNPNGRYSLNQHAKVTTTA